MSYLHGYQKEEQDRLFRQAQLYSQYVFQDVNWGPEVKKIIEPGSGVGAQTIELKKRFPKIEIHCLDREKAQLDRAKEELSQRGSLEGINFHLGSADQMPFEDSSFQGAFICWFLEHLNDPVKVLKEVYRVLSAGSHIYCTEVLNSSFFMDPYSPATLLFHYYFNDYQWNLGGSPFAGALLGRQLQDAGFQNIETKFHNILLDKRQPKMRKVFMDDYLAMLLSAAPELLKSGVIEQDTIDEMKEEWRKATEDPNSILQFSFVQAKATAL